MWELYEIDEQLRIKGFYSLFECKYDTEYSFPGETHNFWECLYVIDGSVCASGDERVYDLSKNEMIFHKPMELHKFYITGNKPAQLLIFSFDVSGVFMNFFEKKAFRLTEEQNRIMRSLLGFLRDKVEHEAVDIHNPRLYLEVFNEGKTYSQMVAAIIEQLFLSFHEKNAEAITVNTSETRVFRKAINVMNSCIGQWLTVTDIADKCNISSTQLKRIFHKYASFGVHKYYLKLKIKMACAMLGDGKSIGEISDELGFCNQNYFSTVFKRETGMAPLEYKKNM